MLQKDLHSIATAIVLDYVPLVLVAVRENARGVKEVVKMDAKQHVAVDVGNVAKEVVAQCVKVIV